MEARKLENYTYEDYLDIDKTTKERVELIFGKIYMMAGASAKHQDVVLNIALVLKNFGKCKPRVAPYDLELFCPVEGVKERVNVVQPDVMLFCDDVQLPCAIFEVLSPSTAAKDKREKLHLYECAGVKEYYIVEPEYKVIERFVLEDGKYRFDENYLEGDAMEVGCIGEKVEVAKVFEGIENETEPE